MYELRPYQQELINKVCASLATGNTRVCAVLGCGGGKSIIQATIARLATEKKNRVLFIVHRKELCEQIRSTFAQCGVDFALCEIGMVQTISRNIKKVDSPILIIVDEAHHILANGYRKIINAFPSAYVLGFTATPCRLNEGGLGDVFQDLVEGVSTSWLIANHYLSPYKYYGVTLADTSKLHTKNGDYDKQEVEELMNRGYVFGSAFENWKKFADGKQTIVYCSSIACSKAIVSEFNSRGVQSYHLDSKTPQKERESVVEGFRKGVVKVLSNVDLFGEGFDVPDCQVVILLRPTKSLSLHIQQSMRSMRYKEGKTAIVLDHVGNYVRHGLPDAVREWTLESKTHKDKTAITVRQCTECFSVFPANTNTCPYCGAKLVYKRENSTHEKIVEEILLEEIKNKPYKDYKNCKTFDELEQFRKAKKYQFVWSIRKAKELKIPIPKKYGAFLYRIGGLWTK